MGKKRNGNFGSGRPGSLRRARWKSGATGQRQVRAPPSVHQRELRRSTSAPEGHVAADAPAAVENSSCISIPPAFAAARSAGARVMEDHLLRMPGQGASEGEALPAEARRGARVRSRKQSTGKPVPMPEAKQAKRSRPPFSNADDLHQLGAGPPRSEGRTGRRDRPFRRSPTGRRRSGNAPESPLRSGARSRGERPARRSGGGERRRARRRWGSLNWQQRRSMRFRR